MSRRSIGEQLPEFERWLKRRRLTPEHHIPFFSRWVLRFLRFGRTRPRESWRDTRKRSIDPILIRPRD